MATPSVNPYIGATRSHTLVYKYSHQDDAQQFYYVQQTKIEVTRQDLRKLTHIIYMSMCMYEYQLYTHNI